MSIRIAAPPVLAGALTVAMALAGAAGPALSDDDDDDDDFGTKIKIDAPAGALKILGDRLILKARRDSLRHRGPGYRTSLIGDDLRLDVNDGLLGLRGDDDDDDDGGAVEPVEVLVFPLADFAGFPVVCGDNTYSFASGELIFTRRKTSDEGRPPPFTPAFDAIFPVATLVGEVSGTATNQDGEVFEVLGIDNNDEVRSGEGYTSTTAVWLSFIDADGQVVDRAAFTGSYVFDGTSSETVIVDHGNCGVIDELGNIQIGPFFVFPFPPDQLITIEGF